MSGIESIRKRDGRIEHFDEDKITAAIFKAAKSIGGDDIVLAKKITSQVAAVLDVLYKDGRVPTVENVQDLVEKMLIEGNYAKTAKAYILYRQQHSEMRQAEQLISHGVVLMDNYIDQADWRVNENSNMSYSLQGLNNHISSAISATYWLEKIYPQEVGRAHRDGTLHIHDLGILSVYCCGWDMELLLSKGLGGVSGKVESCPPKHFRTALGQIVNYFYTLQGEAAGAQAFSNFDTYLAPFIRYDQIRYKEVKQAMQEFIFNVNVPTRVGFQCMSEDTEILGKDGWKTYKQIKKNDTIATFNTEKGIIEYLPVNHVFKKQYKGKMFNLTNRISDQLISPEHRIVRKKFGTDNYVLEKIEDTVKLKSPFIIPIGSNGNKSGNHNINIDIVKLIAWIVAEGTIDRSGRGIGRISIFQSKIRSEKNYKEIISICKKLKLKWTERTQKGIGEKCNVIRFDSESTKKILKYFHSNKKQGIKFIPEIIINADKKISRLFLETYIKGDGHEKCKITTTSQKIRDGLMQIAVNAGYGATVSTRLPDNKLSKKDRYIIRLIKHKDTYINSVKKINYDGIIWCPNTDNETVIARRNGKIFITGNTPFTNITMDLMCPKNLRDDQVIIGGKRMKETYKEFQDEMDMFNTAFAEVMMAGDAKGRIFTFPIPTYNITKDFNWNDPAIEKVWEMTAKYGIPYFSNFINSDMDPSDARSMCCRLRLDNRELRTRSSNMQLNLKLNAKTAPPEEAKSKRAEIRGGGLFGANPMTGSVGVVTVNIPRIVYKAENRNDFFNNLAKVMDIAKQSLEIKRKVLERFTDNGLYPYSKYYLESVKKNYGFYWSNHFSTIGLIGMNEACEMLIGKDIGTEQGKTFALETLVFMKDRMREYTDETGNLYNLEASPAEGTSYRLAKLDKKQYPDIKTAGDKNPYYTNSTQLPVGYTDDLFEALTLQDELQSQYTGGTVLHGFLGERIYSPESAKQLVKKIAENFHLPYYTLTPTFSICPIHAYISGEHQYCPYDHSKEELEKFGIETYIEQGE